MSNRIDKSITFRFKVWIGQKLNLSNAPLCRVFNKAGTESYTLTSDMFVIIRSNKKGSKSTDVLPASLISCEMSKVMAKELERIGFA